MQFANQVFKERRLRPLDVAPFLRKLRSIQFGEVSHFSKDKDNLPSIVDPSCYTPSSRFDGAPILDCLYLPALESLEVCCQLAIAFAWPQEPPCASELKTLVLQHSKVPIKAFEQLLLATPNLETLHYSCCYYGMPADEEAFYEPARMREALKAVSSSLRHLFLSTNYASFGGITKEQRKGIGSLKGMRVLRTLKISLHGLVGFDFSAAEPDLGPMLPASLEQLTLLDDCQSLDPLARQIIRPTWHKPYHMAQVS
ncbi:MAG: hypothetical protein LQ340_006660 [Diploschistes diacapsis]|nr:MAG: hypothetical protein LQ340_006660 [Diploschistes diacapsis]